MAELGAFLERFYSPKYWFHSVEATLRHEVKRDTMHVEHDGVHMEISDPGPKHGDIRILSMQKAGTWIEIYSDLTIDEMVEIALSLTVVQRA